MEVFITFIVIMFIVLFLCLDAKKRTKRKIKNCVSEAKISALLLRKTRRSLRSLIGVFLFTQKLEIS